MNTFRSIRERLGLTQSEIAKILCVSQGNVAHYEKGQTIPPKVAERLISAAHGLGHEISFDDVYRQPPQPKARRSRRKSDVAPYARKYPDPKISS